MTGQAALQFELPALQAPADSRLPPMGRVVARCLENGDDVTLHFWLYRFEHTASVNVCTADLRLDSSCLRVGRGFVPWRDVFYVEADGLEYTHHLDHRRLFDLPLRLAREILAECVAYDGRENLEICDGLRRALKRPHLFSRAAYAPFSWETRARQEHTERCLREASTVEIADSWWGPWCSDYGRRGGEHPDYRASLAQIGMHIAADGRWLVANPRGL